MLTDQKITDYDFKLNLKMNICERRDDLYLIIILIILCSIAREIPKVRV